MAHHSRDAGQLRLHGAGDGSVMAYCGACKDPLPSLPRGRALTLAVLEERWRDHLAEVPR
jgi:ribosomal protein L34E